MFLMHFGYLIQTVNGKLLFSFCLSIDLWANCIYHPHAPVNELHIVGFLYID